MPVLRGIMSSKEQRTARDSAFHFPSYNGYGVVDRANPEAVVAYEEANAEARIQVGLIRMHS